MVEEKSNLEPIGEEDLNLKEKFIGAGNESVPAENFGAEAETETPAVPERQAERKEGVVEKEDVYSKIISKIGGAGQSADEENVAADASAANSQAGAESKISHLVQLAETKGVYHAVKVARHLEDNYTLDEFHDRLLGEELHDALVRKGVIKEL